MQRGQGQPPDERAPDPQKAAQDGPFRRPNRETRRLLHGHSQLLQAVQYLQERGRRFPELSHLSGLTRAECGRRRALPPARCLNPPRIISNGNGPDYLRIPFPTILIILRNSRRVFRSRSLRKREGISLSILAAAELLLLSARVLFNLPSDISARKEIFPNLSY